MPGRRADALDRRHVDAGGGKRGHRRLAVVLADRADEMHLAARAGRGHGLIGSLPALVPGEHAAEHGLTGRGQRGQANDQVYVDRADDDDPARGSPGRDRQRVIPVR